MVPLILEPGDSLLRNVLTMKGSDQEVATLHSATQNDPFVQSTPVCHVQSRRHLYSCGEAFTIAPRSLRSRFCAKYTCASRAKSEASVHIASRQLHSAIFEVPESMIVTASDVAPGSAACSVLRQCLNQYLARQIYQDLNSTDSKPNAQR